MQWHIGGWLGAQLGGSVWMAVAGILALDHHVPTALAVLVLFAVVNVYGWSLWQRRRDVSPLAAARRLMLLLAGASLLAVFVLDQSGIYEAIQVGGRVSALATYAIIVAVFGGLMLFIRTLEKNR